MNKQKIKYLGMALGLFFVFPWVAVFIIEMTAPELKATEYKLGPGFCLDVPANCTATPNNFEGVSIYCGSGTVAELSYAGEAENYLSVAKKLKDQEVYSYKGKLYSLNRTVNEDKDPLAGQLINCSNE